MNAGQFNAIRELLQQCVEQQDEIRRAVNRIDNRLKDMSDDDRAVQIVRNEIMKAFNGIENG